MVNLNLDCTKSVTVGARGKDAKGNVFDVDASGLTVTLENADAGFGVMTDGVTFAPGNPGAKGEIHVKATVNGTPLEAALAIELVHGDPVELAPVLTVVPAAPVTSPSDPSDPSTPAS